MDRWTGGHTDAGPCWACQWDSALVALRFALNLSLCATCDSTSLWPPGSFYAVGGVTEWVSRRDRGLSWAVQGRPMTESGKGGPARWRPGERADAREPGDCPSPGPLHGLPWGWSQCSRHWLPGKICVLSPSLPGCRDKKPSSVALPDLSSDRPRARCSHQGQGRPRSPGGRPTLAPTASPSMFGVPCAKRGQTRTHLF